MHSLQEDLDLLAGVRPGRTLSVSTRTIVDHDSWSVGAWRRFQGEGRERTIMFAEDTVKAAVRSIEGGNGSLRELLLLARGGVSGLSVTYKDDSRASERLSELLTLLDAALGREEELATIETERPSNDDSDWSSSRSEEKKRTSQETPRGGRERAAEEGPRNVGSTFLSESPPPLGNYRSPLLPEALKEKRRRPFLLCCS